MPADGDGVGRFVAPSGRVPILVVDDSPEYCDSIALVLRTTVLVPFAVHTAAAAFRFLDRHAGFEDAPRPAIIVLDFVLPDANAPAVLTRLRADPKHAGIPVLVLTAFPTPDGEQDVLQAGAQAYVEKPWGVAGLRRRLVGFWRTHVEERSR